MAALRTAFLVLLLWAPLSDAAFTTSDLAQIVNNLLNVYKPTYTNQHGNPPMFSLAISIPLDANQRPDFSQVTAADPPQNVKTALDNCQVYTGARVVAATLLKYPDSIRQCPNQRITFDYITQQCPAITYWRDLDKDKCKSSEIKKLKQQTGGLVQHAEYRVLQSIQTLTNRINTGDPPLRSSDLLLFYTYKSPCSDRCCSPNNGFNILTQITNIQRWSSYAMVFSNIFEPGSTSVQNDGLEQNRRTAIQNLGNAIGGVGNVYRCTQGASACASCSPPGGTNTAQGGVNNVCVQ